MEIALEKLALLVSEAFDRGAYGCADLKQQEIDDLFKKFHVQESDEFRVWKIEELRNMPQGSIFQHMIRGRCVLKARANGTKFMQFDKGQTMDFNSNQDPWDKPMHLIYSGK